MPSTYTLISSNVLSSSAASVTFSAIPSTYTDLVLRISSRSSFSGTNSFFLSFNGAPSGTSFSTTSLSGRGSTAFSLRTNDYLAVEVEELSQDAGTTANTFNSVEYYIPNYLVSANKPVGVSGAKENNSSTVNLVNASAGLWRNTSAITSITIDEASGNFVSGSSFYLYGIKNS